MPFRRIHYPPAGNRFLRLSNESGYPYIIPYRVTRHDIEILTVMHAAQQWPDEL